MISKPQRKIEYARDVNRELPYGIWIDASGREVLFDRRYRPDVQRLNGRVDLFPDPYERVHFVKQGFFYNDGTVERGLSWRLRDVARRFIAGEDVRGDLLPEYQPLFCREQKAATH